MDRGRGPRFQHSFWMTTGQGWPAMTRVQPCLRDLACSAGTGLQRSQSNAAKAKAGSSRDRWKWAGLPGQEVKR